MLLVLSVDSAEEFPVCNENVLIDSSKILECIFQNETDDFRAPSF